MKIMEEKIKEIGKGRVIQIVTDNARSSRRSKGYIASTSCLKQWGWKILLNKLWTMVKHSLSSFTIMIGLLLEFDKHAVEV